MPWDRAEVKRSVTVVIPARYGSSRFPGKPLIDLMGKPMIQHVYEQAKACRVVDDVLVATDDDRIKRAVEGFGGQVLMMTEPYRTGTDRVAAVAKSRGGDCYIDLQGDEILLHPDLITDLVEPFLASDAPMGTLKRRIDSDQDLQNTGVVKVTTDREGNALYFSRAPIPLVRDDPRRSAVPGLHFIHLGLYIYTRETLASLTALPTGILEDAEKLEQLRALENGIRIRVWETSQMSLRIDSPEDVPVALTQLRAHTSRAGSTQP
ncbi:MAG: 3-deoxy-manno-octulosonate cytidylyltransferase [Nitrospira sp.]|nr:3-deoxy-manno-octulosonate cytidylyltransferase [Nitrospira sp.]MCW5796487.1 3-deoxy-manno-octulosonate cytidylyltransferase [Nitrospira sp.]